MPIDALPHPRAQHFIISQIYFGTRPVHCKPSLLGRTFAPKAYSPGCFAIYFPRRADYTILLIQLLIAPKASRRCSSSRSRARCSSSHSRRHRSPSRCSGCRTGAGKTSPTALYRITRFFIVNPSKKLLWPREGHIPSGWGYAASHSPLSQFGEGQPTTFQPASPGPQRQFSAEAPPPAAP